MQKWSIIVKMIVTNDETSRVISLEINFLPHIKHIHFEVQSFISATVILLDLPYSAAHKTPLSNTAF